jgi:hypothetical protein
MHIPPFDNLNKPVIDVNDARVPLNYFNIVKLLHGQSFTYQVPGYETGIIPATGTVDIDVEGEAFAGIGQRGIDVWDGEPEGAYAPSGARVTMACTSESAEVFVAGARFDGVLSPFAVRAADIDRVQYGSDDTKTRRKIKHILGSKYRGCRSKPGMTKPTISASAPTTASACSWCSARMARSATPITSSMVRRSFLTRAIILAWRHRATKCITSPYWAA